MDEIQGRGEILEERANGFCVSFLWWLHLVVVFIGSISMNVALNILYFLLVLVISWFIGKKLRGKREIAEEIDGRGEILVERTNGLCISSLVEGRYVGVVWMCSSCLNIVFVFNYSVLVLVISWVSGINWKRREKGEGREQIDLGRKNKWFCVWWQFISAVFMGFCPLNIELVLIIPFSILVINWASVRNQERRERRMEESTSGFCIFSCLGC